MTINIGERKKTCPNWQPDYHKLSSSNYLSIHYIKETNNLSKDVRILLIVAIAITLRQWL